MAFLKFLRTKTSELPQNLTNGFLYFVKSNRAIYMDHDNERVRYNPPADWNQTNNQDASYIANKPTTISGYGITDAYTKTEIDSLHPTPTSEDIGKALIVDDNGDWGISEISGAEVDGVSEKTVTGSLVTIEDAVREETKDVKVKIEPVQEGEGDPSPTNVRPISGFSGVNVVRTGKNLWNFRDSGSIIEKSITSGNIIDDDDKTISWYSGWDKINIIDGIKLKENTSYTIILKLNGTYDNYRVVYTDLTYQATTTVFTLDDDWRIRLYNTDPNKTLLGIITVNQGGKTYLKYDESGIFEGVLTAEDFEPYQGTTHQVTFPTEAGTVYGGELNLSNGELVVDRASVDLGTLDWTVHTSSATVFKAELPTGYRVASTKRMCSIYANGGNVVAALVSQLLENNIYRCASSTAYTHTWVFVKDGRFTLDSNGAAELKTALSGEIYVYEIEPITYHLTPQQISLLLDTPNNLYADTGDITLTYTGLSSTTIQDELSRLDRQSYDNVKNAPTQNTAEGLLEEAKVKTTYLEAATKAIGDALDTLPTEESASLLHENMVRSTALLEQMFREHEEYKGEVDTNLASIGSSISAITSTLTWEED